MNPELESKLSLVELIEVTEPYLALKNIKIDNQSVTASVTKELIDINETEGLTLAEAGRHIAILGSLATAHINPIKSKHYYLASAATIDRITDRAIKDINYHLRMEVVQFNRKKAIAKGYLSTTTGEIIYKGTITYSILPCELFERMFKNCKQETNKEFLPNPYIKSVELFTMKLDKNRSSATLGDIDEDNCLGHFDNYPALPVAQISQSLMTLAGKHHQLRNEIHDTRYCVKRVEMKAERFVFAGETLDIDSTYIEQDGSYDTFAFTNGNERAVNLKCWFY